MTDILLSAKNLSVRFGGVLAVNQVSFDVKKGEVFTLIGPNGAGKTTVFNVISGFLKPDSGRVDVDGRELKRIRAHRLTKMGISRTLQGVGLFASLSALDNVMIGGSAQVRSGLLSQSLAMPWTDIETERLRVRALAALAELGIEDQAARLPSELPYPIQKKVALARALVSDPKVLLLDEPAGGIGAPDMAELGRLIRSWVPERTVLLVEHHMELVMSVCDLIWVLDAGKVIASGTPDEVRNNPAVLAAYLGEEGAA